ncbi:hypothetical protein S83_070411, partial [Arachis hypogaea]
MGPAVYQPFHDKCWLYYLGWFCFKEKETKDTADYSVAKHYRMELLMQQSVSTVGLALEHMERTDELGSTLSQGYGLTESCAGCFIAIGDLYTMTGTVGIPMTTIEARLESVPEMGYDALSSVPHGKICLRGVSLFSGYHKRQDLTHEVMVDGWFHTSDIGEWQPNRTMKIIDRKKNIFKLSHREYVAVESIENKCLQCPLITSVYGNSFESFLVAMVVPERKALEDWALEHNLTADYKSLCDNLKARKYLLDNLNITAQKHQVWEGEGGITYGRTLSNLLLLLLLSGIAKKNWKPELCSCSSQFPCPKPPLKLIASVPFLWEEKSGTPLPNFSLYSSSLDNIVSNDESSEAITGMELETFRFDIDESMEEKSLVEPEAETTLWATCSETESFLERDENFLFLNQPAEVKAEEDVDDGECTNGSKMMMRKVPTLGEQIMMSRRRSYRRKALHMNWDHNPPK